METKQEHYESMMQAIARYAPSADLEVIQRAYAYADEKHKNQLRKSGEPYIIHPLAVAEIVAEIGLDTDAIAAALLHDCLEDTDASFEEISRLFGETVANLVEGVTKLTRVQYSTMEEQQMENLRKMFMAMSKDIRVILIKISDRLHNTRTLQYQTPAKQISKSMETMEVYAPLAHRLGMTEEYPKINAEDQIGHDGSIYQFYKEMIAFRQKGEYRDCLIFGDIEPLQSSDNVIAYRRFTKEESIECWINLSSETVEENVVVEKKELIWQNSDRKEKEFNIKENKLVLKPFQAVLLKEIKEEK